MGLLGRLKGTFSRTALPDRERAILVGLARLATADGEAVVEAWMRGNREKQMPLYENCPDEKTLRYLQGRSSVYGELITQFKDARRRLEAERSASPPARK